MNIYNKFSLTILSGLLITIATAYFLAINYGDIKKYKKIDIAKTQQLLISEKYLPELKITYTYKKQYKEKYNAINKFKFLEDIITKR